MGNISKNFNFPKSYYLLPLFLLFFIPKDIFITAHPTTPYKPSNITLNELLPDSENHIPAIQQNINKENPLLQYTSGGHVIGFKKGEMYTASLDHALKVKFAGSNDVSPVEELSVDSTKDGKAKPLENIIYKNLWDNVTLVYEKTTDSVFKSTYYVAPSANPSHGIEQIRLRYNVPVTIDQSGNLLISLKTGQFTESAPIAWQEINGKRVYVDVRFSQHGEREIGFKTGQYDPSHPLIIDPSLTWNTFMGGSGIDYSYGIAVDSSGNIYVTGQSRATWGSPVLEYSSGRDGFAAKLDSSGALIWSTFLGGSGSDNATGIAVDSTGNVYVAGYSYTTWGSPVTPYTFSADTFVAKLSGNDGSLTWNTFMGGSETDYADAIAVDSTGNVYVAGNSSTTWGSPVRPYTSGNDAYAAKLSGSDGSLTWNTFLGGSSNSDYAYGIALDSTGNVYVVGTSDITWGSPLISYTSGSDAFAAKLTSSGILTWNTFMGGNDTDYAYAVAVDSSGNVYVAGYSAATWGSPLAAYTGGEDAFAAKLDTDGALTWNTFMGGTDKDRGQSIAVDSSGNVYVGGFSAATWGAPLTAYTLYQDAFAAELTNAGALIWNTFLGGSGYDSSYGIAVDSNDNVYVAAQSDTSWGSPVTALSGGNDAFVAKIAETVAFDADSSSGPESSTPATLAVSLSATSSSTITVDYTVTGTATGSGTDYTLTDGTLSFTAGTTTQNISVVIVDDSVEESDETIIVTLSNAVNTSLGTNTIHTYTITNNDSAPTVAFDATSSSGGEASTPATMAVSLSNASAISTITVEYAVTSGTATGSGTDYTLTDDTLTFSPGTTTQNISAVIVDDSIEDADETIIVTLSNPDKTTLGTNTTHTYVIADNDSLTQSVFFTSDSSSQSESTTSASLAVSLSGSSDSEITVNYAVTGGTATGNGTDYTLASGTLTFSAGTTTKNISVTVVDDSIYEYDETIIVTLSNQSNATLGPITAHTYTITEDEVLIPTLSEWGIIIFTILILLSGLVMLRRKDMI